MLITSVSPDLAKRLPPQSCELSGIEGVATFAYHRWKPPVGRVLAGLLLIPGLPIMAVLFVLVRLMSPGPAIYRQLRVGQHGRIFWLYKIRTMVHHAEAESGPVWTQPGDPRVTRLGRILRKLHLDEFPQLFNVLRREMALVGPRPERPEFVSILSEQIPGYSARLAVKPGITGLAQINLPPDSDLESVRRKLALDVEYISTGGPLLDMQVMLCTAVRLLGLPGELSMRLFRLKRAISWEGPLPTSPTSDAERPEAETVLRRLAPQPNGHSTETNGKNGKHGKNGRNGKYGKSAADFFFRRPK